MDCAQEDSIYLGVFSEEEKNAIKSFEEKARKLCNIVGQIKFQKGIGERIEIYYTAKTIFRRTRIGKMINPDNYDVIERISEESRTLLVSSDGKTKKLTNHVIKSTDSVIERHYYRSKKIKVADTYTDRRS
nr:MAG TPA: hypothetical protein [Caudoviricetes sp.]